jgi:hypothetical protein
MSEVAPAEPSSGYPLHAAASIAVAAPESRMDVPVPTVTVVIPTRGRPQLLQRAIASVLAQTVSDIEVVVVVDGYDPETTQAAAAFGDPRIRSIVNGTAVGGAEARNIGIRAANGGWIALLDDDDEWLPTKLERQLRDLTASTAPNPVGFTKLVARTPGGDLIYPRRPLRPGEHVSAYMLSRTSFFAGEGVIQTSTIMAKKALFEDAAFAMLPRYQETDWILRVSQRPDVTLVFTREPLTVWYTDEPRASIMAARDWTTSLDWAVKSRSLMTPESFGGFLLVGVAAQAAAAGNRRAALRILREARKGGRPAPIHYLIFLGVTFVPSGLRRRARWLIFRRPTSAAR